MSLQPLLDAHPRPSASHGLPIEGEWGYSQAIAAGGLIYVAGQVPRDDDGVALEGSFEELFARPFELIRRALAQLGATFADLVFVQAFMKDADIEEGKALLAQTLSPYRPAVQVGVIQGLNHPNYRLEVCAVARDPEERERDVLEMQHVNTGNPVDELYGRSTAVRVGQFLFVSGQPSVDEEGKALESEVFAEHYELAFANFVKAVEASGASQADIVSTITFVTQAPKPEEVPELGKLHHAAIGSGPSKPASTLVQVSQLSVPGAKVELSGVCVLSEDEQ